MNAREKISSESPSTRRYHGIQLEDAALHNMLMTPVARWETLEENFSPYISDFEAKYQALDALAKLVGDTKARGIVSIFAHTSYGAKSKDYGEFRVFSNTQERVSQLMYREGKEKLVALLGPIELPVVDAIETYAQFVIKTHKHIVLKVQPDAPLITALAYITKDKLNGLEKEDFVDAMASWKTWKAHPLKSKRVEAYASFINTHGAMIAHAIEDRWQEVHAVIQQLRDTPGFHVDAFLVGTVAKIMGSVPRESYGYDDLLKTFIRHSEALRQSGRGDRNFLSKWIEYNLLRAKEMDDTSLNIDQVEEKISHALVPIISTE